MTRGSHDEGKVCPCVSDHRPPVLELNDHHILPLYLGGPDVADNLVTICPNAHVSTHELLRLLLRDGLFTYRQAQERQSRPVSRYAYDLAVEGYRRYLATRPPEV